MHYTYLWIDILTIAGPLALSFDKKVAFYRKWPVLFYSIGLPALAYLIWDIIFTKMGVWKFNSEYILGPKILSLPVEEILFFISIPYSCLFIYECISVYFPNFKYYVVTNSLSWAMVLLSAAAVIFYYNRLYTSITALLLLFTLLNHLLTKANRVLPHAILAWLISVVPMLIVNGLLTGLPILIYNDDHNLGVRIGSIPVEDFFYNLILMLWMIDLYSRRKLPEDKTVLA